MMLEISRSVVDAIVAEADRSPCHEVCGLLLGSPAHIRQVVTCRNVAADPSAAFEIDPARLIAAHRAARAGGPAIVGCYHSHPTGASEPSATDAAMAAPDGWIWVIAGGRGVGVWRAVENGSRHGRFDAVEWRAG